MCVIHWKRTNRLLPHVLLFCWPFLLLLFVCCVWFYCYNFSSVTFRCRCRPNDIHIIFSVDWNIFYINMTSTEYRKRAKKKLWNIEVGCQFCINASRLSIILKIMSPHFIQTHSQQSIHFFGLKIQTKDSIFPTQYVEIKKFFFFFFIDLNKKVI